MQNAKIISKSRYTNNYHTWNFLALKQELPVAAMFVNESGRNEQSL
jgi:hypothetical protein